MHTAITTFNPAFKAVLNCKIYINVEKCYLSNSWWYL